MKWIGTLVIAFLSCAPAMGATVYTTGFEQGEGYTLGDLNGQQGWVADSYPGDCVVQNVTYSAGSAAMQVLADGTYDPQNPGLRLGAFHTFADPTGANPVVTFLQDVRITATNEADYLLSPGFWDSNTGSISFRSYVLFDYLGNIFVNGTDSNYDWTANTWQTVKVVMDFSTGKADVFYGTTQIATDANFTSTGPLNAIVYATDDYYYSGSSMFVDEVNITATPEPLSLGLVALGGLGLLRRRRK